MSWKALHWAEKTTTGSPTRKAVLLILANYADESHSCYPGVDKIATITELGRSTVHKAIAELVNDKLIKTLERRDKLGGRISNRYLLLVDGPDTKLPPSDDYTGEQAYKPPPSPPPVQDLGDREDPTGEPVPDGVEGFAVALDSADTQRLSLPSPLPELEGGPSSSERGTPAGSERPPLRQPEGGPPVAGGGPAGCGRAPLSQPESLYKEEDPLVDPLAQPLRISLEKTPPPPPVPPPATDGAPAAEEEESIINERRIASLAVDVLLAGARNVAPHRLPGRAEGHQLVPLVITALRSGWHPDDLAARLAEGDLNASDNVYRVLRYRLTDGLPARPPAHRPRPQDAPRAAGPLPPWCRDPGCDPHTRQLLDEQDRPRFAPAERGGWIRLQCPDCSPATHPVATAVSP